MTNIDQAVLVVRSVTSAMKGQKLLEQTGISAYVERNTAPNSRQGCGYGLKIRGDVAAAAGILSAAGIKVSEIQRGG